MKNFILPLFLLLFASYCVNAQTYLISQGGTISTCSGSLFDSGGSAGDFQPNENYTITLCPSTASCISLTFSSFDLGLGASTLTIYNGSNNSAPLLGTFNMMNSPGSISANTSGNGCLTLAFKSDPIFPASGWAASIACVNCTSGPTPNVQDCPGAIPICQNVYSTTASYTNSGNIPVEINTNSSCLGSGELNDVWYTFTVAQTGNLNFNITPNNMNDDYDWAIYNLTNNACADIFTNPSLEVSCNFSAMPGVTGANGGSTLTSQDASGTPANAELVVTTGQTYVVNISNFSSSQNGYTIDFGQSTATIFDNIPPTMKSLGSVDCNDTTVLVNFSENILCNSVQTTDFTVSGPGGPYAVTATTSPSCAVNGQYDNAFTLTVSPAFTTTGIYTLCLVGGSGSVSDPCSNTAVPTPTTCLNFNVTCQNTVGVTASGGTVCNGGSATVSAINIGGTAPYTYTWSPNIGTGSGPFSVAPATSTVYTVTIVDANGVSATDTAQVFVNTTPVANAGNDTTVCAGSIVILHGSGATSYQWSGGPATANYTVSPTVTTTYTLTALNGSCSDTETVVITVTPGMNINVIPTAVSCFGGSNGSATATVAGGAPAYTYSWNTTPVQTTATASGLQAGTYTLTVTDQSNCINSVSVSINEPPAFTVNLNGDTSICAGESSTLTATVNGGVNPYTYTWNNSLPTGNPQMVSPTQTTTYIVTAHDHNACTATKQITVNVAQKPIIAFTKADSGCVPHTAVFINATQNAATYLWRFGDGTTSVLNSPLHVYSLAGVYSVTLIADNNGCIDSLKKPGYIHVFPQAKAALTATPAIVSEIYPEIVIDNLSTGQDHCELYFGDGVMSNNCNDLSHIYPAVGTYTITLMAITNEGCNDTTSIQITIEPETTFFIPEAFSPNADGHNELFMAFGTNINSFQIVIFNRWGNLVYTGNDLGKGWDGNINGNKAPEDVYVYKVTYTDYKDRKHNLKGRFSLIR